MNIRHPLTDRRASASRTSRIMLLLSILAAAPFASAQTTMVPSIPDATLRYMNSGEGASWNQIRRNGLILNVSGKGEYTVATYFLVLDKGRVTERWNSRSQLTVRSGENKLPGDQFIPGDQFVTPTEARTAYETASVATFFDRRTIGDATGVLILAVPTAVGSSLSRDGAETKPLFVRPKLFGE